MTFGAKCHEILEIVGLLIGFKASIRNDVVNIKVLPDLGCTNPTGLTDIVVSVSSPACLPFPTCPPIFRNTAFPGHRLLSLDWVFSLPLMIALQGTKWMHGFMASCLGYGFSAVRACFLDLTSSPLRMILTRHRIFTVPCLATNMRTKPMGASSTSVLRAFLSAPLTYNWKRTTAPIWMCLSIHRWWRFWWLNLRKEMAITRSATKAPTISRYAGWRHIRRKGLMAECTDSLLLHTSSIP